MSTNSVNLVVKSEYSVYSKDKVNSVYVNCNIKAPECPELDRKPVDLVVVLDRSGSMSGSKLELCKKTIEFLIRELSPKDRLSIVSYDTNVRTDMRLTLMDNKGTQSTEGILKRIRAGSATNLSGGLLAGVQEIQSETRTDGGNPNPIQSVLLLTDGLANHGITDTSGIIKVLEGSLKPNVTIFTFGYGSDHNVEMLREISEVGRGVYYFVQNIDGVSLAFADCLGGLLSVVAQNIKLECVALAGSTISSVKTRRTVTTIVPQQHVEIELGDLYGEEERDVLLEIILPALPADNLEFSAVECRLNYANVLASSFDKKEAVVVVQRCSEIPTGLIPESTISQQKNRILAAEAIEAAKVKAENGELDKGRKVIQEALNNMMGGMNVLNVQDKEAAQALLSDLKECEGNMATAVEYNTRGRHRMCAKVQSHWAQRSNDIEISEEELAPPPAPGAAAAPMAVGAAFGGATKGYRNKKKGGMLRRAFAYSQETEK